MATQSENTPIHTTSDLAVRFLSVREAAEFLRVSPRTVYGWVSQRALPHRKAGRRVLFLESELVEWTQPNSRGDHYRQLIR